MMEAPRSRFFSSSEINKTSSSQTWLHTRIAHGAFKSTNAKVTPIPTKSKYLGMDDINVEKSLGINELLCKQGDP